MAELQWNYGDLFDEMATQISDRPALVHGDKVTLWRDLDQRSNNLAHAFLEANGVEAGDKAAFYLKNHPAYLEGTIAAFKARLVHVNVNYRYVGEELLYLLDNCDATVLVYGREFAPLVAEIRPQLSKVRLFLEVGEKDEEPSNSFAQAYEELATNGDGEPIIGGRSPDDMLFIYTGGTTGKPKGVMWRHQDRIGVYSRSDANTPQSFVADAIGKRPRVHLACCPFMHSTGLTSSIDALLNGGSVVIPENGSLHAEDICAAIDKHKVTTMAIVGDAVARPILDHLSKNKHVDVSSVRYVFSSGVMWSEPVKKELLSFMPNATMIDTFGSSEGSGLGSNQVSAAGSTVSGQFKIGKGCKVFTEDHQEVLPGSGVAGMIAKSGNIPVGYYKDPEKSARTFPTIEGVRYSIPGDWCVVEADGTIKLLGRGSGCINTGGEKVFAEEVEEVLKLAPEVEDALVFGIPDERWGSAVVAVIESDVSDVEALRTFVRQHLADYKTPKKILSVNQSLRLPNGKPNYELARLLMDRSR